MASRSKLAQMMVEVLVKHKQNKRGSTDIPACRAVAEATHKGLCQRLDDFRRGSQCPSILDCICASRIRIADPGESAIGACARSAAAENTNRRTAQRQNECFIILLQPVQNTYFSANCMIRGSPEDRPLVPLMSLWIFPNVP